VNLNVGRNVSKLRGLPILAAALFCSVALASGQASHAHNAKPAKKAATTHKPAASRRKSARRRATGPLAVYRTGHGNHGMGTIKAPPRYVEPLPPSVAEPPEVEPATEGKAAIENRAQLGPFFSHLAPLDHAGEQVDTVRVMQFGDSHTAADMFTGRMRSLFQLRFGNGGAGFSYAGHPFAGYRILGTSRSQSSGWIAEGVHFTKIVNTELGLGGVANTSSSAGDSVSLDAPCTQMQLLYLDQPNGGAFSLFEDGSLLTRVSTENAQAPETLREDCTAGVTHHFEVVADSHSPVRLFGFVTLQPGVTYEALGLNGAEASLILRWDQPIFTGYLRQSDPALIVLAYGTNEAGNSNWSYEAYSNLMARLIDSLHATVPGASILVIGPPDRSTFVGVPGRGRRRRSGSWTPFRETLHITQAQRDVCRTHGCAFWSWRDRMGGLGSINRWVSDGLAQPDHTHFTSAGYVRLADFLYSDMIAAYDAWKAEPREPAGEPASPLTTPHPPQ
jgi:lysophospholipase L1-like esterase